MKNLYTQTAACCLKIATIILFSLPLTTNAQESMRANLYVVDANGATLVDGNLTNYNSIYSNAVDIDDAWKMTNPGINFGIVRETFNLVVERRTLIGLTDTTFFRMWNLPQYHYRIRFVLKNLNHPGMGAIVKDNYLNIETNIGLNDTTYYDFNVDANSASSGETRFQVIFGASYFAPVDVSFTGIQAQRKGKDVFVEWGVASETSMESYIVEHSADGRNFQALQQVRPYNTPVFKTYNYNDLKASSGDNFYRIKGISINGKVQYSPVATVRSINAAQSITVYPNPVVNKTVQLQFNNQPEGKYNVTLLHNNGVSQQLSTIQVNSGQGTQSVNLPYNLIPGVYRLQLTGPDNKMTVKNIQVL